MSRPRTEDQKRDRWSREAEARIYREQTAMIAAQYDKETADAANYGQGVDIVEDMVCVDTKVYGVGRLSSVATRGQRQIDHQWR